MFTNPPLHALTHYDAWSIVIVVAWLHVKQDVDEPEHVAQFELHY